MKTRLLVLESWYDNGLIRMLYQHQNMVSLWDRA